MYKIEYPLGKGRFERPEIGMLKKAGHIFNDPREIVSLFESVIADFCGSKYAVAVDSLTNGIFLALKYYQPNISAVVQWASIPKHTYCSIPMALLHAGLRLEFDDRKWKGHYQIKPFDVWDCATQFKPNMYIGGMQVLSFQHKKRLCIGKGGMILTDDKDAYDWLKLASFEGRNLDNNQWDDEYSMIGWNMYMTPDDAARGLLIFDELLKEDKWDDWASWENYPDLSTKKIFNANR